MNNLLKILLCAMLWVNSVISVEIQEKLINTYPSVVEKLVYFKRDKFKAFYGGPIDKKGNGVKWIMPVAFEDELNRTRAIYEIAFINCTPHTAQDAEILFIDVPEINIKLKNNLTPDYIVFSSLLNGNYKNGKYVVVRFAEIANVYYPDIFVFSLYGNKLGSDKDEITRYLHEFFHTQRCFLDYYKSPIIEKIFHDSDDQMLYEPIFVQTKFDQQLFSFYVVKAIRKKDIWKVYYLIYRADTTLESLSLVNEPVLVRLDSGCISGQVYDDEACDCLDQLHDGLHQLIQDVHPGIIIHIPTHDGRGFGTAPKAETEIYKRGGKGRIHSTVSLDTVAAAKLLYGVDNYDFRSFDGATQILVSLGIKKVILLTDNLEKVATLQKYGIEVLRKKTETNKASCIMHIEAKKNSSLYFSE